jgi:hypothetical protein
VLEGALTSSTNMRTDMRILEPLTARFVDDVIRLVREATAEGLRTLLGEEAGRPRPHLPQSDVVKAPRRAARVPTHPSRPIREPARRSPIPTANLSLPAPGGETKDAEITDPQWLLAMGAPTLLEVPSVLEAADSEVAPESVSEGPPSAVREAGGISPVRLRANETLARVSNAGVVIRRAR